MRSNKCNVMLLVAVLLLIASTVLAFNPVVARYKSELTNDFRFQTKPIDKLDFAFQEWQTDGNVSKLNCFLIKNVDRCRVYLAVSEGVVNSENLKVYLTVTGDEIVELKGTCERIPEASALAKQFGQGYVYYFYKEQEIPGEATELEQQNEPEEWSLAFKTNELITLQVTGLASAVEATTLLRLFIEQVE